MKDEDKPDLTVQDLSVTNTRMLMVLAKAVMSSHEALIAMQEGDNQKVEKATEDMAERFDEMLEIAGEAGLK